MTTWASGICEADGVALHWRRTGGAKPPVVLLHGLTGSGACWAPVARALEGDFDVVMPDARGPGRSSRPEHGYRYEDLADDVLVLVGRLELSYPVLLGHSMGGMTAAMTALRAPDRIRGLVLVDPTFLSPERQREVYASDVAEQHRRALDLSASELVEQARARHPQRASEILELQAEARLQTCAAAFDVLTPPNPDYRAVMRAIDLPTLLVIGDTNPVVTAEMATELGRANRRLRVESIERAGHGLPFEQPERLGAVARSFLREIFTPAQHAGPTRTAT